MRIHFAVISALVTSSYFYSAWVAAQPAGKIIYALGATQLQDSAGKSQPARKGDAVAAGQTLVTQNGRMQVRFADGGFIVLHVLDHFV